MREPRRLPSLDGIRALAITLVLCNHLSGSRGVPESLSTTLAMLPSGQFGVQIFFVVSGFIITYLLENERRASSRVKLGDFYLRRVFRIAPAMYLFLLWLWIVSSYTDLRIDGTEWTTSLLFVRNFVPGGWYTGHLWSISVEEQFYLLWPACFLLRDARSRMLAAGVVFALAPVARLFLLLTGHKGFANVSLPSNADFLMVGALVGLLANDSNMLSALRARPALRDRASAIVGVAITHLFIRDENLLLAAIMPTLRAVLFAYLIASYTFVEEGLIYGLLNGRYVTAVGRMSYSLYLWQQPFLRPADTASNGVFVLSEFPFNIICVVSIAALSYLFVEVPMLRVGARVRSMIARRLAGADPAQAVPRTPAAGHPSHIVLEANGAAGVSGDRCRSEASDSST